MRLLDDTGSGIGDYLGDGIKDVLIKSFEGAMKEVWDAALELLHTAFGLADQFSVFTVDIHTGPVAVLWPLLLWISGALAIGLFFWQLTVTNVTGGRGFVRLISGPVQYGIALGVTVGVVATFLAAVDGLTDGILRYGLQASNFTEALSHVSLGGAVGDGVKSVVLGICAVLGVIPAAVGDALEMLFRQAAIYVLVATIPIVAAGLLASVTARWFWIACRWLMACIAMKPVLAICLVLGVAAVGGAQGFNGVLAGIGILDISLVCPWVLFRLFAFVDPNTDPGGAFRDALAEAGMESYGSRNPVAKAAQAVGEAFENANTARFDEAADGGADGSPDETGSDEATDSSGGETGGETGGAGGNTGADGGDGFTPPPSDHGAANRGRVVSSSRDVGPSGSYDSNSSGDPGGNSSGAAPEGAADGGGSGVPTPPPSEPATPEAPNSGGGASASHSGAGADAKSGGGDAAAGEAETAVIL